MLMENGALSKKKTSFSEGKHAFFSRKCCFFTLSAVFFPSREVFAALNCQCLRTLLWCLDGPHIKNAFLIVKNWLMARDFLLSMGKK